MGGIAWGAAESWRLERRQQAVALAAVLVVPGIAGGYTHIVLLSWFHSRSAHAFLRSVMRLLMSAWLCLMPL